MLVKAEGRPEVTTRMLVAEVFGNAIARRMGAPTAQPALVSIGKDVADLLGLSPGHAAGCDYLVPLGHFQAGRRLTTPQFEEAAKLYAFDLLADNPDRQPANPNCAVLSDGLLAYDFGDCFAKDLLLGAKSWTKEGFRFARQHLFWEPLHQRRTDCSFDGVLNGLTPEWRRETSENAPAHWQADLDTIWDEVEGARRQPREFVEGLRESLR